MTTTYTNNMFHFEQTSPCGGFVDAYVKKDSDLGRKLTRNNKEMLDNMVKLFGDASKVPEGFMLHINQPSVKVNGTEYIFYDHATFGVWDLRPEEIRKTCKRFVKTIERQ